MQKRLCQKSSRLEEWQKIHQRLKRHQKTYCQKVKHFVMRRSIASKTYSSPPDPKTQTAVQKPHFVYLAVALTLLLSTFVNITPAEAVSLGSDFMFGCNDVEILFARGSGEDDYGTSYTVFEDALLDVTENIRKSDSKLVKIDLYDLGTNTRAKTAKYEAAPVTGTLTGIVNLIGAAISGGEAFIFARSVSSGVAEILEHIEITNATCPDTKFVLVGFSQGAMVVSKSIKKIEADKIIYAATLGDPKLYLPEGKPNGLLHNEAPDACRGINLSNYRAYVPDCHAYEGALGSYQPYQPDGYWDKLGTWCNNNDIICSSGMSVTDHIDYVNGDFYQEVAKTIRYRIDEVFTDDVPDPVPDASESEDVQNIHDVVFLFDATRSMETLIDNYKSEAKELLKKVLRYGGRVAAYAYRDYEDGWPELLCAFGCSEDELSSKIDAIEADKGDDTEEGLLSAIKTAFDDLYWRKGATKSIVVLTDNGGYHDPDADGSTLSSIIQQSLAIDPVNVYVISKPDAESKYTNLVNGTNGAFFDVLADLTVSTNRIFNRPVASLDQESYYGVVGDEITFDASASYGFAGEDLTFDWDLDGNGTFEKLDAGSKITQTYNSESERYIQVRISDSAGSSTMSAKVKISRPAETPTTITKLTSKTNEAGEIEVEFETDAAQVLVTLGDLPIGFSIPEDGQGSFVVEDLVEDTELGLVPYSENEIRGTRASIIIEASAASTEPTTPTTSIESTAPATSTTSASTSNSTAYSTDSVASSLVIPGALVIEQTSTFVPSVPNTGTCDRKF